MSLNNDPNGMLSEKCRLSIFDGSEMNMKEVIASSKLLDASVGMEHQKPAVKRKKSKKAKNSVEGTPVGSNMEHAKDTLNGFASTEPHNAFNGNHSSNEADKGESILSQTERTEVLKTKVKNTSLLGVDREIDAMSGNEMESFHLTHISKTQVNTEDMADAKVRKKTKKQSSTAKNLSDLQKKELDVGPEVSTSSTHKIKVDVPSKIKRKAKSVKTSSTNQFKRSKLETEKDAGTEVESLHPKQDPGTFDSSQFRHHMHWKITLWGGLLKLMLTVTSLNLHALMKPMITRKFLAVKVIWLICLDNHCIKLLLLLKIHYPWMDIKLMPESDSKFSKVSRNDLKSPHDIDASTRTPSDSSASSDYTEGENNQHLDSSHGLYSTKRNESGAKSIGKSNSSGSKNVTMDVILRSSSRFKKAKLTASQSELNDTESQHVEFVPDSPSKLVNGGC
ncbi:hypothetical protein CK203_050652 [Vitis vinifera]|uniref:Uncharacterized protein n=1 Tax=Vitis vinifera TaxID=29760 RepID=A0A438GK89_VITVI|nr:hypothetical protein CK203_050652 [Vitis vinifera]